MKCPSCGYVSFDSPATCKKCGAALKAADAQENIFIFDEEEYIRELNLAAGEDGVRDGGWRVIQEEPAPLESSSPLPAAPLQPAAESEVEAKPEVEAPREVVKKAARKTAPRKTASPKAPPPPLPPAPEPGPVLEPAPPTPSGDAILEDLFNFEEVTPAAPIILLQVAAASNPEPVPALPEAPDPVFDEFRIDLDEPVGPAPAPAGMQYHLEPRPAPPDSAAEDGVLPLRHPDEIPSAFWGDEPAGFGRRAGAFLIDQLLVSVLILLFMAGAGAGLALTGVAPGWLATHFWPGSVLLPLFLLATLVSASYFISWQWLRGSTPGMRGYRIKVVGREGQRLSLADALFRWLGCLVSAAPLCLGFLWALWDRGRLTWHDRLSSTMVVSDTEAADKSA